MVTEVTNTRGAPEGNDNSAKGSIVRGAIRRALAQGGAEGRDRLNAVVERMVADAEQGDKDARRELFDRLDGKPHQTQSTDLNASRGLLDVLAGLGKTENT